ncbi:hypothetical protein M5C90_12795 [Pseudomonas chlororaphis subsp. piscium]|nr:hypothetical protein M5C90_12795 [Pseudomonas chlororaphis subsp. piscium]
MLLILRIRLQLTIQAVHNGLDLLGNLLGCLQMPPDTGLGNRQLIAQLLLGQAALFQQAQNLTCQLGSTGQMAIGDLLKRTADTVLQAQLLLVRAGKLELELTQFMFISP